MLERLPFFSKLISPIDPRSFFTNHWGRAFLHIHHRNGSRAEWLTTADLDLLFQSECLPAALCNVVSGGVQVPLEHWSCDRMSDRGHYQAIDVERLFQCYLNGATVILNQAHYSVPPLAEACRNLTTELGFRVWTNIYITPPNSSGFARHEDDHEVLVLQIMGTKDWTIYPDGAPVVLRLEAGDLLYLPRSTAHSAHSANGPSIHVTFGMRPTYRFDLVEELARAAREHPAFRQPLNMAVSEISQVDAQESHFASDLSALLTEIGIPALLERRLQTSMKSQAQGWPGRFADIARLQEMALSTVVRLRPGIAFRVRQEGEFLEVDFASRRVTLPAFLRTCLEAITSGQPSTIRELPGLLSDEGKVDLAKSFVRAGLVEIVPAG
jgi:hypothetical protein